MRIIDKPIVYQSLKRSNLSVITRARKMPTRERRSMVRSTLRPSNEGRTLSRLGLNYKKNGCTCIINEECDFLSEYLTF